MKFVPHNYQRYCINRMITDPVLGLFLDMGLGKTVITLTAVNDLRFNRFAVRKVLVIAPKKVAEDTWTRESQKWDHLKMLRVIPVLGSIKQRIRAINTPGDVWVLSRDNVSWLVDYYKNDWPFDMVIIDELSSFKSNKAKRFRKLKSVRNHIHRIVGLTGTPTPNGLEDLWAQIYLLDEGKRLGKTLTGYRDNYFTPGARNGNVIYEYNPRTWADEEINERIKDICISMKAEDYLELPERIDNVRHIKLPDKAKKQYEELEKTMIADIDGETIDVTSAAYGLNLQAGGHIIVWFGLNWSLELYQQANARLYRQGQKENVVIHHLVTAGGYDENVMDALEAKEVTQDSFLNALKARIKSVKGENDGKD